MPGPTKRQKEKRREEKRREKEARREERRRAAAQRGEQLAEGEDPDIAGIVPGPQPRLDEFGDADETEPGDEDNPEE